MRKRQIITYFQLNQEEMAAEVKPPMPEPDPLTRKQTRLHNANSTVKNNQTDDIGAYIVFDDYVKRFITEKDYTIKQGNSGLELTDSGKMIINEFFRVTGLTKESQKNQRLLMTLVFRVSIATNAVPSIWREEYQTTDSYMNINLLKTLTSIVMEIGKYSEMTSEEVLYTIDQKIIHAILDRFTVLQLSELTKILDETSNGFAAKKTQEYLDSINDWRPLITKTVYDYIITL